MINTEIRQFRNSIITMTNASPLPIEIKRLVFSEVMTKIESESDKIIMAEQKQSEKDTEESKPQEEKENE